jgi:hypothetical protein
MDDHTRRLLALGAITAPALHTLTDAIEWAQGGFSPLQLWLNYLAFAALPFVMIGVYAYQRPRVSRVGLLGAVLYGYAFVYFAHTTLVALETRARTYHDLWTDLGHLYTLHGAVMVAGGLAFGWATARGGVFPRWTARLFLAGVTTNLVVAFLPVPEIVQVAGSTLRNTALVGMGVAIARAPRDPRTA